MALILDRRRFVAGMHDDDVAIAGAMADPVDDRVRGARAEPVPVPEHPAPADEAVIDPFRARVHRPAAPSRVRPEYGARPPAGWALDPIRVLGQPLREPGRRPDH